jgi:hypothetical protein
MNDETEFTKRNEADSTGESKAFGVSMRGWLAFILVFTVCLLATQRILVEEPMYTIVVMAVSFYFGQKTNQAKP